MVCTAFSVSQEAHNPWAEPSEAGSFALIFMAAILATEALSNFIRHSPEGYEDALGFHYVVA